MIMYGIGWGTSRNNRKSDTMPKLMERPLKLVIRCGCITRQYHEDGPRNSMHPGQDPTVSLRDCQDLCIDSNSSSPPGSEW